MSYQDDLRAHLSEYKKSVLHIDEPGVFHHQGREIHYEYILPTNHSLRNLTDEACAVFLVFPAIRRHMYFHHLNSSQAFALNLFFPYFTLRPDQSATLLRALGSGESLDSWAPEAIPDAREGTNVDAVW